MIRAEYSAVTSADLPGHVREWLPTFLIVGAPKAGTTSLHEYLAVHPEIAMSSEKEPMCFEPPHWQERLAEYPALFGRPAKVRGESSTAYSAYPWAPEIPDRVRSVAPRMKILYLVRDPIPRTLSHFAQNVWDRKPVRPWDELMDDLEGEMNMPVWCSRYATQLARWTERFSDVLVLDQRDLRDRRADTLRRVFAFLGVDAAFSSPAWSAEHNTATDHRRPRPIARRLPARLADWRPVRRLVWERVPVPEPRPDQLRRLEALLAPEAARLREMTGLALDHWSI